MAGRLPPKICLMLARKDRRAKTVEEIAKECRKTTQWVRWLVHRDTYEDVPIDLVDRFQQACGITPRNMAYQLRYLQRTYQVSLRPLHHLDKVKRKPT